MRSVLTVLVVLLLAATSSSAGTWPPADPNQGTAAIEITTGWASGLRAAQALDDVQRALGAGGKIEAVESKGSTSRAVFSWAGRGGKGRLRLFAYRSGGFSAIVDPADSPDEIVLNSFGAFSCRHCSPPVSACGRRPSWVPHEVHWDTYDCPRTITGPQDMPAGGWKGG
jgi:hypothetical protein